MDCFLDGQETLNLIRDGLEEQYVIDQPEARDLLIIELLKSGFISEGEISEVLRARGYGADGVADALNELESIGVVERNGGSELLTFAQRDRFDRQLIYFADLDEGGGGGWELQRQLSDSHVVVLGCGGLGSWAATGLGLAGVGKITLIDDDCVELSNLNRQVLFRSSDVGRPKVDCAADALKAIDPTLTIASVCERLDTAAGLVGVTTGADFLVMTADEPPYELAQLVNQACLDTDTPWISAGQIPPLVRIGPTLVPNETACHACQEAAFRRENPGYEELSRYRSKAPTDAATLGAASGTIGSLIAMEVIHYLTGVVNPATLGRSMVMDLRTFQVRFEDVEPDLSCGCASRKLNREPVRASTVP